MKRKRTKHYYASRITHIYTANMEIADPLPRDLRQALYTAITRLAVEPQLPWLLAGGVAQMLGGIELTIPPQHIAIITGAAEVARIVALLDAVELEPLATRSAPGFAPSPRGVYVFGAEEGGTQLHVAGDVRAVGRAGELSLALERIWELRVTHRLAGHNVALVPLEIELMCALLGDSQEVAYAIAAHLLAEGARWERLEGVLAQVPALEAPLWELMDQVRPMAKRARGRRVRQQTGWGRRKAKG